MKNTALNDNTSLLNFMKIDKKNIHFQVAGFLETSIDIKINWVNVFRPFLVFFYSDRDVSAVYIFCNMFKFGKLIVIFKTKIKGIQVSFRMLRS